jgi:hypothetical protein
VKNLSSWETNNSTTKNSIIHPSTGKKYLPKKTLEDSRKQCFPDVSPNAWYAEYICSAKELGLANGHQDGLFRPNNPVSAHEAIAFLSRMMDAPLQDAQTDWYEPYEEYADANDLFPAERYNTNTYILRGEVTELTSRFLKKENGEKVSSLSVGCGKNPTQNLSPLLVNGVQRSFLQYIPDAYRSNTPHGLVVAVHGRTNSNAMVKNYMGLEGGKKWQGERVIRKIFSWSTRQGKVPLAELIRGATEPILILSNNSSPPWQKIIASIEIRFSLWVTLWADTSQTDSHANEEISSAEWE